jgi:hypothetical protein
MRPLSYSRLIYSVALSLAANKAISQALADTFKPRATRGPGEVRLGISMRFQDRSKYRPHQGQRECARRRGQIAKSNPVEFLEAA